MLAEATAAHLAGGRPDGRRTTVLVVDDSQYARLLLSKILQDHGLQVVGMAENAAQGLELYDELRPDVVTFDLVMPDGGVIGIQSLLYRHPKARIIVVSSVRAGPELEAARGLGVAACVTKPVQWDELDAAFAKALA